MLKFKFCIIMGFMYLYGFLLIIWNILVPFSGQFGYMSALYLQIQ